jgi:hypothetical protein
VGEHCGTGFTPIKGTESAETTECLIVNRRYQQVDPSSGAAVHVSQESGKIGLGLYRREIAELWYQGLFK